MDGTSKDSSLLIHPFARRTPPSCCVRAHPLAGGPAAAGRAEPLGGSSSLLPSLRPGKPRRRKAARKEAAGEQWAAPGGEAAPAALPPAPPPPGPAPAASCGLARRSAGERGPPPPGGCRPALLPGRRGPSMLPTAAADGRPPLTLEIPQASLPVQRRAAEGARGFTRSAAHPQTLPPHGAKRCRRGERGCPAGPPPAPLPSLSRGRRCGRAGLWEPSALRRLPPTSCHRPRARPSPRMP